MHGGIIHMDEKSREYLHKLRHNVSPKIIGAREAKTPVGGVEKIKLMTNT